MKIRIEDYVNEPILLSSRFRYPQKPILRLNEIQRKTKKKIEKAIRDGFISRPIKRKTGFDARAY